MQQMHDTLANCKAIDSVRLKKQLNNVRYDWQGGENSEQYRAHRLHLQLNKIIALLGPSCLLVVLAPQMLSSISVINVYAGVQIVTCTCRSKYLLGALVRFIIIQYPILSSI